MSEPLPVSREEFFSYLEKLFSISSNDINLIIEQFHAEMQNGLSGVESSLKMIPSFVDKPSGEEKGEFLALDLGGTNLRVLAVRLEGEGDATVLFASKFAIPQKIMQGNGEALFDFIAGCIDAFLIENQLDRLKTYNLTFIFSFPVEQTGISAGKLILWTKGFTATGVQGRDVIGLLDEALERKGIRCIKVMALANDTVGTLAAGSYTDPACDMGVIMGTGTNACYREAISNIKKLKTADSREFMIVNMEWGNFDKVKPTCYDRTLDARSVNPGAMYLEKMVSGMYLGEIARIVLMDLLQRRLMFVNEPRAERYFHETGSLRTKDMSRIVGDKTDHLDGVALFLERNGISDTSLNDRIGLKRLCRIVSTRAARLGAAAISAVLTWMDPNLENVHTVGIDGSLFEKYPEFNTTMAEVFKALYGEKAEKITLVHSKDGSGKGAAVIAAVADSRKVSKN